jgi:S1-C subfamily serine protease
MTYNLILSAALCVSCAIPAFSSPHSEVLTPEALYSSVTPSIVILNVETYSGKHFVGNAFLVEGAGLAVTAWHVIHDAKSVEGRFSDNQRTSLISYIDKNEKCDLALMQISMSSRTPLKVATAAPKIGSRVYVIGAPRGLDFSLSEGLVSQIRTLDGVQYYQLSCPISPGDSGGPAFNDRGEVIGVVSWRKAGAENVAFAVPAGQIAGLNSARKAVAWADKDSNSFALHINDLTTATPHLLMTGEKIEETSFLKLQAYLAERSGRRVTITIAEGDEERRFSVQIPQVTGKIASVSALDSP